MRFALRLLTVLTACIVTAGVHAVTARDSKEVSPPIERILVIDGSPVHDVGSLWLHTGNWGAFGSRPTSGYPYSSAPSAEWPAGSGIEYLWEAGLWVGAIVNGVPAVSTASYEMEFRPTSDPTDVVYYAAEGDPGGNRAPDPNADDDGDGSVDEEWLDGHDNDGDGAVDEDFAAISDQMQSCWYTDDQPEASQIYPDHTPLHITVRQRSYQWADPDFDDFVGFEYTITNTGSDLLEDVYVGLFVDGDAGSRTVPNYYSDDGTGFYYAPVMCTQWGATPISVGYGYDVDGDGGQTPGYCGVALLDHLIDPAGTDAPAHYGFTTYQHFSGAAPYADGGDPTNDFERYEAMSAGTIDRDGTTPRDYRYLVAVGPFASLAPGESLEISVALVAGDGLTGSGSLVSNAVKARLVQRGQWFNLDNDPATGVAGRETPVVGPATDVVVDGCALPPVVVPNLGAGEIVWVNDDCQTEVTYRNVCGYAQSDSALYATGIAGRETRVPWILPTAQPVPVFVTTFDVEPGPSAAVLAWEVFTDEDIRGFEILRENGARGARLVAGASMLPPDARAYRDDTVEPGETYAYTLTAVGADGSRTSSKTVTTTIPVGTSVLHQNVPNPFNPSTVISFVVASPGRVTLSVFTPEGKRVATLVDGVLPAGPMEVSWDGTNDTGQRVSSGVYICRLEAGKSVVSRKMTLLK